MLTNLTINRLPVIISATYLYALKRKSNAKGELTLKSRSCSPFKDLNLKKRRPGGGKWAFNPQGTDLKSPGVQSDSGERISVSVESISQEWGAQMREAGSNLMSLAGTEEFHLIYAIVVLCLENPCLQLSEILRVA